MQVRTLIFFDINCFSFSEGKDLFSLDFLFKFLSDIGVSARYMLDSFTRALNSCEISTEIFPSRGCSITVYVDSNFCTSFGKIWKVRFPIIGKADDREERKFGVATMLASSKQHTLADCATLSSTESYLPG